MKSMSTAAGRRKPFMTLARPEGNAPSSGHPKWYMVTVAKYNNVKKLSINGSFFQVQLYLSSYQKMKEKSSIFLVFLYTEITVT